MPVFARSLALLLIAGTAVAAQPPQRTERGNLILEGIPDPAPETVERLNRYQQTRGAALQGFLPDGSLLISTRFGETAQIHHVATPLGARSQLTFYPEPVAGALTHPKQNGFVFGKDTGGNEFFQLYWFDRTSGDTRLLTDGKSRNTGAVFSRDGQSLAFSTTRRNGKDVDIHILSIASGESRPLLEKEGEWSALDFSPDGRELLVQRSVSITESELYRLDLASHALTRFHPTPSPVFFGAALYAHDGKRVFFTSDEGSEFRTLQVETLATGKTTKLSAEIPWNVEELELSPDGRRLAFVSNEDGISALHLLDAATGKPLATPKLPVGQIGKLAFDARSRTLAFSLDRPTSPSDIYSFAIGSKTLTRWTESEVGGLNTAQFLQPELVRYPTFDGRQIPAFVYKPKGIAGKRPVLINIHGGPESQALPVFTPSFQFYLKELGIAVITPNVRGSDGYGKSYLKLDNGFLREDSVKDIGALLDWIATQPDLDASRVVVAGGSYGGYMTLASMTHYNDRLRAGIDVVGISNFVTFLTNTQDYRRDLRRVEYGDERIPEMRAFQENIAPLNNAAKITKPMFIVQGMNDPRVPYTEAEQMVARIRANGGEVWYLAARDEGHGFRKKGNRDFQAAATVEFLKKTLLAP